MDKAVRSTLDFATRSSHVMESRSCLPFGLQEKHLQALRHHASLLAAGSRLPLSSNFTAKKRGEVSVDKLADAFVNLKEAMGGMEKAMNFVRKSFAEADKEPTDTEEPATTKTTTTEEPADAEEPATTKTTTTE